MVTISKTVGSRLHTLGFLLSIDKPLPLGLPSNFGPRGHATDPAVSYGGVFLFIDNPSGSDRH